MKTSSLELVAIYFLWIACVVDPSASMYSIKFVSVAFALGVLVLRCFLGGAKFNLTYVFILFFFVFYIPLYGLFVSSLRGGLGKPFIDTSYIFSAAYMICSFLYFYSDNLVNAYKAMIWSLRLLSALVFFGLIDVLMGSNEFIHFFVRNDAAFVGERIYAGVAFNYIYFIVSPMLIFLVCHDSWKFYEGRSWGSLLMLVLSVGALFLSGTRANMMVSCVAPIFTLLWLKYGRLSLVVLPIVSALGFLALSVFEVPVLSAMFSAQDHSNAVKLSYLDGYYKILGDIDYFLWGQGFNAHLWSGVLAGMLPEGASKTELTYFELLRVFGVFGLIFFMLVMTYVVLSKRMASSCFPWVAPALTLYLMVAASNPYIFSSNGMLLVGFSAAVVGGAFAKKS